MTEDAKTEETNGIHVGDRVFIDKLADPYFTSPYVNRNTGIVIEIGDGVYRYKVRYDTDGPARFNYELWFHRHELKPFP